MYFNSFFSNVISVGMMASVYFSKFLSEKVAQKLWFDILYRQMLQKDLRKALVSWFKIRQRRQEVEFSGPFCGLFLPVADIHYLDFPSFPTLLSSSSFSGQPLSSIDIKSMNIHLLLIWLTHNKAGIFLGPHLHLLFYGLQRLQIRCEVERHMP